MKKIIPLSALFLAILLLAGCSLPEDLFQLVSPDSYTVESKHPSSSQQERQDDFSALDYKELCGAIREIVSQHSTEAHVIVPADYTGNISEDAKTAVYDVWKSDPLSAYAVDYISAECSQLLNYYEVSVNVNYRRSEKEIDSIVVTPFTYDVGREIRSALDGHLPGLTVHLTNYRPETDWQQMISQYCSDNPESIMEEPEMKLDVFPAEGSVRILEFTFSYSHSSEELNSMKSSVSGILNSAAGYVRYRSESSAKADLLYSYFRERFDYVAKKSDTPMYSFLCEGITDAKTVAQTFHILLNEVEIPCNLVSGYLNGEPYWWIILTIDGVSHHADPFRDMMDGNHDLTLLYDEDMSGFSWDTGRYPSCPAPLQLIEKNVGEEEPGQAETDDPPSTEDPEAQPE